MCRIQCRDNMGKINVIMFALNRLSSKALPFYANNTFKAKPGPGLQRLKRCLHFVFCVLALVSFTEAAQGASCDCISSIYASYTKPCVCATTEIIRV